MSSKIGNYSGKIIEPESRGITCNYGGSFFKAYNGSARSFIAIEID
jgi:hypothetical protein